MSLPSNRYRPPLGRSIGTAMIQLQDVSRTYASDEVETTALGGIDLHIEKGARRGPGRR
jgi:hypothetical protein